MSASTLNNFSCDANETQTTADMEIGNTKFEKEILLN